MVIALDSTCTESQMDQQLVKALELHQQKRLKKLSRSTRPFLKGKHHRFRPSWTSSILRAKEQQKEAISCLTRANSLSQRSRTLEQPWELLLRRTFNNSPIKAYRCALSIKPSFADARVSLAACLRDLGHSRLAYATIVDRFKYTQSEEERRKLLIPLVEALLAIGDSSLESDQLDSITKQVEREIEQQVGSDDPCRAGLLMTQLWLQVGQLDALSSREKMLSDTRTFLINLEETSKIETIILKSWHGLSWNLSIKLLKQGRFAEGWNLYEHGLQVPAAGPQRWQRSLKKPFTPSEVSFWRGESLSGKRLLLLGEQGIGDSMMFATLIPRLIKEGAKISLYPGDRLINIYRRSLPDVRVLSSEDIQKKHLTADDFDLQSPLGPSANIDLKQLMIMVLRDHSSKQIQNEPTSLEKVITTVGLLSESAGKEGVRQAVFNETLKLKQLSPLLQRSDCRFVSLQYGNDAPHLERFQGDRD